MVERAELEKLFAGHGTVRLAEVIDQLKKADSTGTGFVEMDSEAQSEAAIAALNGMQHRGFALVVGWDQSGQNNEAQPTHMFESINIPDISEVQTNPVK